MLLLLALFLLAFAEHATALVLFPSVPRLHAADLEHGCDWVHARVERRSVDVDHRPRVARALDRRDDQRRREAGEDGGRVVEGDARALRIPGVGLMWI